MSNLFPLLKKIQQDRALEASLVADALQQTNSLDAAGVFPTGVFLDNDGTANLVDLDGQGNPVFTPIPLITDPTVVWSNSPAPVATEAVAPPIETAATPAT